MLIKCTHCGRMDKGVVWKNFGVQDGRIIRLDDEILPLCSECFQRISLGEL